MSFVHDEQIMCRIVNVGALLWEEVGSWLKLMGDDMIQRKPSLPAEEKVVSTRA